jgi:site-specific recombinase XerD
MTDGNRGSSSRPSRLSPPLTPSEQERLWCACSLWYVRERLVLALLLEMGLRPREACSLSFHDIQPGELSVLGKDWHMRTVSLGNETKLALDRYLASAFSRDRRRQDEHAALLLISAPGTKASIRIVVSRRG